MKHPITRAGLVLCAVAALVTSLDVKASSLRGHATVDVVGNLSIFEVDGLDFGAIIPSATAGTIRVTVANIITGTGGATHVPGTGKRAKIGVFGPSAMFYYAQIPNKNITVSNGSTTMAVTLDDPFPYLFIISGGRADFYVGGTLNVGANQATGTYTGTYQVRTDFY